jgi:hypothetical protein
MRVSTQIGFEWRCSYYRGFDGATGNGKPEPL